MFTIGRVTGVHGLAGALKVWSYAQSIERFAAGTIVLLQADENRPGVSASSPDKTVTILGAAPHKKGILLTLEGVNSRTEAEKLKGHLIRVSRETLPEPEDDSWYWQDLIGLEVTDEHKGPLGVITQVFATGANDVLVVRSEQNHETLVPMHKNFVASVDLETRRLFTTLPEDYE